MSRSRSVATPALSLRATFHARAGQAAWAVMFGLTASLNLAHAAADPKASRYYEDALGRYEKRDMPGAIIQLKNALQIDRSQLPVQVLLGKALLADGQVVAAEVALTESIRLGVNRAEVAVPLAQALIAQGKQKKVFDDAQLAPAGLPPGTQVTLWLLRSAAATDLGDAREALKAIDEARIIDPNSADAWLAEVPVRIRARQFREAMAAAERGLALAPSSAEGWYQKGSVLHVRGDLRGALAAYDHALAGNPAHLEARIARAGLYIDFARVADASADLAELRRLAPREPRGAYLRALLAERSDPAEARRALVEVTTLMDPVPLDFIRFRPQLLMLNGLAHHALNEREKAKLYLETLLKQQPGSPVSKLLAQIYVSEGNPNRAVELLEAYLKAQPGDPRALTLLAAATMGQGKNAKAAAMMQEALRGAENRAGGDSNGRGDGDMRLVLGMSLIGAGQAASAAQQLEAAYRNDPRQGQAAVALIGLYLRGRQADKALPVAEDLARRQPANAGAWNLLGTARAQAGNVTGAREALGKAVALDPALVIAQLNLARLDVAAKAYDAAATRLDAVLKADQRNVDALMEQARLAEARGDPEGAERGLRKASDAAGPRELRPGLALVDFQFRHDRPAAALEAAKALSTKAPDDLAVLMAYARAQLATGGGAAVRATLTNATRQAEFDAPAQVEIATLQLAAGNPAGASYSLEKALSAHPDYVPAMALMVGLDLRQGELARAEQRARQIVENNPKRAIGHGLLADVAQARGQNAAALDALKRAHQIEPGSATFVRLFRAMAGPDGGKPAFQLAEQWLKSHPNDVAVRRAVADAYARAGDFGNARASYEAVLRATPDDAAVLNNLANVLLRLKDPGAVKLAEQAVAKRPGSASAIDTLGWALFQAGDVERALPVLRDARLREPGNPEIRFHLATALAQSGRRTEARDEIDAALKSGAAFERTADAEQLARTLR